jgi:hypothetical protein
LFFRHVSFVSFPYQTAFWEVKLVAKKRRETGCNKRRWDFASGNKNLEAKFSGHLISILLLNTKEKILRTDPELHNKM